MEVLFINFNYRDMLNQYLANIYITKTNLSNLHFNIKGKGSSGIHKDIANDIEKFNKFYDQLAEQIKKIGGYPIMNLDEIKNISTIKEISSKDYTPQNTLSILIHDLSIINNMNNQVGEYALKNNDLGSINLTLEFNTYLQNRLWLLRMDI